MLYQKVSAKLRNFYTSCDNNVYFFYKYEELQNMVNDFFT